MKKNVQKKQVNTNEQVSLKYKFLSMLFMLVITAVALTTASYAWFTANSAVSLEGLDVNVNASNGIQLSMDAVTWKARLTVDDIKGAAYTGNVNQIPTEMVPVSSALAVTEGKLNMYKGDVTSNTDGDMILTASKTEEASGTSGDFIAFDIFVQSAQEETLELSKTSDVTSTNDKGLKNASRVAFLNLGTVDIGNVTSALSLKTLIGDAVLWEPNSNVHTAAGIAAAYATYGKTITASQTLASYYGVNSVIESTDNVLLNSSETYFTEVVPTIQTNAVNSEDKTLLTIGAGITKIRIYCWIEGQDVDCENNASGTGVTFKIDLAKKVTAEP